MRDVCSFLQLGLLKRTIAESALSIAHDILFFLFILNLTLTAESLTGYKAMGQHCTFTNDFRGRGEVEIFLAQT